MEESKKSPEDNKSERIVWICGVIAMAYIGKPWGLFILLIAAGGFWFANKPENWREGLSMFWKLPKKTKVFLGALLGGFTGSFMGIAAMGNATAATVPLAVLMGYLVHVNTRE